MERDDESRTTAPDGRPLSEQLRWRRDFPIDVDQDLYVSRRDFTRFLVLTSFSFVVGQAWILLQHAERRPVSIKGQQIAMVDQVPVGGSTVFTAAGEPYILVRLATDRFVAYGQKCTHLSCPVIPQPELKRFRCPCHEGAFDIESGRPIQGPPRRPLPRVRLDVRDGCVYALGLEDAPR